MSGDHDHGSAATAQHAGARYRRRMLASFVLIGGFFVVELVGGASLTGDRELVRVQSETGPSMQPTHARHAATVDDDGKRTV